jgi:hypothetical protein
MNVKNISLLTLCLMLFNNVLHVNAYHNIDETLDHIDTQVSYVNTQLCMDRLERQQCYAASLPTEKNMRRMLYWLVRNNPHWFMLDRYQKDVDFYITILLDHIKILEAKLLHKINGFSSMALRRGVVITVFGALWGYASCQALHRLSFMEKVILSVPELFLGMIAVENFKKAYYYVERVLERLERDRRILAILEKIKANKKA